jgi:hypothetical protein
MLLSEMLDCRSHLVPVGVGELPNLTDPSVHQVVANADVIAHHHDLVDLVGAPEVCQGDLVASHVLAGLEGRRIIIWVSARPKLSLANLATQLPDVLAKCHPVSISRIW